MTRNSWLAMTGLCALLATSVSQAHPLTLDSGAAPTNMFCWQKADGKASAGSESSGNCPRPKRVDQEATLDRAMDIIQFDSTQTTNSPSALDMADGRFSLLSMLTINHSQADQLLSLISAAGNIGGISIGGHSIGIRHNTTATSTANVPEPETLVLMMVGLIGASVATRGRRASK